MRSRSTTLDLGYAQLDIDRARRTGDAEVVYGEGKSPEHVVSLLQALHASHPERAVLATRLSTEAIDLLAAALPDADLDSTAGTATLGLLPSPRGLVLVVSAGTSDARVAREAATTARVFGAESRLINDVGVAGLHRVMAARTSSRTPIVSSWWPEWRARCPRLSAA